MRTALAVLVLLSAGLAGCAAYPEQEAAYPPYPGYPGYFATPDYGYGPPWYYGPYGAPWFYGPYPYYYGFGAYGPRLHHHDHDHGDGRSGAAGLGHFVQPLAPGQGLGDLHHGSAGGRTGTTPGGGRFVQPLAPGEGLGALHRGGK